jgi:hypothetical protein
VARSHLQSRSKYKQATRTCNPAFSVIDPRPLCPESSEASPAEWTEPRRTLLSERSSSFLSSRAERPDCFFRAVVGRVGPRSRGTTATPQVQPTCKCQQATRTRVPAFSVIPSEAARLFLPRRSWARRGAQSRDHGNTSSSTNVQVPASNPDVYSCLCCHPDRSGRLFLPRRS